MKQSTINTWKIQIHEDNYGFFIAAGHSVMSDICASPVEAIAQLLEKLGVESRGAIVIYDTGKNK